MNWWVIGTASSAVLAVVGLVLWKMVRKNVAKEISYDINQQTKNQTEAIQKKAKEIEKSTDTPDPWL